MPFDRELARVISDTFRQTVTNRLDAQQRLDFERLLQQLFGVKNLRNVQLWTRPGAQQRNFIYDRLGERELDLRVFLADRFIQSAMPTFPVKTKGFELPASNKTAFDIFKWLNDSWIRAYCTRIFISGNRFFIEYAADSNTPQETPDLDSPEFEDLVA